MAAQEINDTSLLNDANIVNYYRMEGNSNDTKGASNGTDTDMSYNTTNGLFGQNALFNGSSSKITFATTPALGGDFTLYGWFYPTTLTDNAGLITKRETFANLDFQMFQEATSKNVKFQIGGTTIVTGNPLNTDVWNQVALTRIGNDFKLYQDNVVTDSTTSATAMPTGDTIRFGVLGDDAAIYYTGRMDDMAIFDRGLTAAEISDLFDLKADNLQGYFLI